MHYILISLYNNIAMVLFEIMSAHALVAAASNFAGGESVNHSLSVVS
jgi:hypothetical protein